MLEEEGGVPSESDPPDQLPWITSVGLAVIALLGAGCCVGGFLPAILGAAIGVVAVGRAPRGSHTYTGAMAGLVANIVVLTLVIPPLFNSIPDGATTQPQPKSARRFKEFRNTLLRIDELIVLGQFDEARQLVVVERNSLERLRLEPTQRPEQASALAELDERESQITQGMATRPAPAPAPPKPPSNVGQSFRIEHYSYVVDEASVAPRIGPLEAAEDQVWLVIDYRIRTNRDDPESAMAQSIVRNATGAELASSAEATAEAMSDTREDLTIAPPPGIWRPRSIVFGVPASQSTDGLELVVPPATSHGSETRVRLTR